MGWMRGGGGVTVINKLCYMSQLGYYDKNHVATFKNNVLSFNPFTLYLVTFKCFDIVIQKPSHTNKHATSMEDLGPDDAKRLIVRVAPSRSFPIPHGEQQWQISH